MVKTVTDTQLGKSLSVPKHGFVCTCSMIGQNIAKGHIFVMTWQKWLFYFASHLITF